jgi:hypothetical protein
MLSVIFLPSRFGCYLDDQLISDNGPPAMDIMNSPAGPPETVICAAVRASNGKIVSGRRHNDAICALQAMQGMRANNRTATTKAS